MATQSTNKPTMLSSYVGFDTIPKQIEHKLRKRGFLFNVMLVGQTGLGKSTLINTLFATHLIESKMPKKSSIGFRRTTEISTSTHLLEENGVQLTLNVIDTPGFGDQVNNDKCWKPIVDYIRSQHDEYLRKELKPERDQSFKDPRVHCCLYFIAPTGHALKPLDILVLQKLMQIVNVVPVLAKSDALTLEERTAFKRRIQEELAFHSIRLYPYDSPDDDKEDRELIERVRQMIPFAVVGSERNVVVDGKAVRGRRNRWSTIDIENEDHCEFVHLRSFLTRTHLNDMIECTSTVHYASFREKSLKALAARHSGGQTGNGVGAATAPGGPQYQGQHESGEGEAI